MLIARYKFDSSLYDLIPEFNSGYEGYTVTDDFEEGITVFEDEWSPGSLSVGDGVYDNPDYPNAMCTDYIQVTPGEKYFFSRYAHVYFYKVDKTAYSYWGMLTEEGGFIEIPSNIHYVRLHRTSGSVYMNISLAIKTRTIECDTLPTEMRFGNVSISDRTNSLLEILYLDTSNLTTMQYMFTQCLNLSSVKTDNWDTSQVRDMSFTFSNCQNLIEINPSNWNTSQVNDMTELFYNCNKLTELDLNKWDVSKVVSMGSMFRYCQSLMSLNIANWDTSQVNDMTYMFYDCSSLAELNVSNWNTSQVSSFHAIFCSCSNLTKIDVSKWDVSQATSLTQIFYNCTSLASVDVRNWNTKKAIYIGNMFCDCHSLTNIDISNFNMGNIISISGMFARCYKLISLDVGNWEFEKDITTDVVFQGTNNLKYLKCNNTTTLNTLSTILPKSPQGTIVCKQRDLSELDMATLNSKNWTVTNEPILVAKYVFDKSIYNNMTPTFNGDFEGYFIEDVEIEGNEVTRVIESCGMLPTLMKFGNDGKGALKKLLDIDTSEVTKMTQMFFGCKKLSSICGDKFNTSKVTHLDGMFYDCAGLNVIDISSWDVSNVTNMYCMFQYCQNLISVGDLSNWNTSRVTDLGGMFLNCMKLASLNISTWDVSNVTSMWQTFYYCNSLTLLDLSNWNMSKVTDMKNMLLQVAKLTDIGMLNCDKSTIQKIVDLLPTDINGTIWYKETNIEGITVPSHVKLREYKEENVEIVLNSPLLEGDTIEMVDGNLCHVHRWGKVVFDGSESWTDNTISFGDGLEEGRKMFSTRVSNMKSYGSGYCNNFTINDSKFLRYNTALYIGLSFNFSIKINSTEEFKQWLQENPTAVVYEIAEPTYENITPLQSELTLKTLEECSMEIITNLPIKTNITYRTNITSVYELERQVNSVDTSGVSLANLIEEEVDE